MTGIVRALLEHEHRSTERVLLESFFANNFDLLMPVVHGLMKTAARPLIYKLWKSGSRNAVLALAALKKLRDQGDPNPIQTLYQMSDLDVPTQFLKRLAWEAGLRDIPGVHGGHKPTLMPSGDKVTEAEVETPEGLKNEWKPGETAYFEYHCNPSHDSEHAEWWYRSRQPVTVLGIDEPGIGDSFVERGETSGIRTYNVRFRDGFEAAVFEDELWTDPRYFSDTYCRPPSKKEIDQARAQRNKQ